MATGSYTAASPKNYLGEPWTYTFRIVHWQRGPTQSWHDLISAIWTGALMNTKNASMDYPVQLWQSHFKKSVEKWDDIQKRPARWILSSSLLQAANLL